MNAPDDLTEDLSAFDDPIDEMVEEFLDRVRKGESPSIGEYVARHPEHVDRVRKVLGAAAMMEQLGRSSQQSRFLPERFGEFRVLRELGSGGMGVVYEAVQESLWRHVAVKTLHVGQVTPKRLQRFQREAQAVAQLHHTNIVPIFGVGEHEGLPYYVMQYIRGKGLDVLVRTWRRDAPIPDKERWRFAVRVGIQAAEALGYAHRQGILHRDIKPSNILIDDDQTAWITDFGLAKLVGGDDLTNSGDVIGTLRYLAPEALRGEFDRRGEVYSLGLTLYELVTLHSPFPEMTPSELLRHVTEGALTAPRQLVPSIPPDLETIVLKAIAHDPADRYQSAAELAEDLKRFRDDRPILARRVGPVERLWRWSRRNRSIAAMTGAVAASLVLAAMIGLVGFALEAKQRSKAEANGQLAEKRFALAAGIFETIFERYAARDQDIGPIAMLHEGGQTPRSRGPGGPDGFDHVPGGHDGFRRGPGGPGGPDDFDHGPGGPGGPGGFGHGPGGPGGPGGPPGELSEADTVLLQAVLSFYDQFAQQSATNSKLQSEAAWAYRRVGALYRRLDRDEEADEAIERAIGMLEKLVVEHPKDQEVRARLVESTFMLDPQKAEDAALAGIERRFLAAQKLIDKLVVDEPSNTNYLRDQEKVVALLGATSQRLGRLDEAEAHYRRAIALAGSIHDPSGDGRQQIDRLAYLQILIELQVSRGRADEAKASLSAIRADLEAFQRREPGLSRPLADRARLLAEICESLGAPDQAEALNQWADKVGSERSEGRPSNPDRPGPRRNPGL